MAGAPDPMNWMNFWSDLQKQTAENWQSTMRQSAPMSSPMMGNPAMGNPMQYWQDSIGQMWRAFDPAPPPTPEQAFWKSTQTASEWFLNLAEQISKAMQGVHEGTRMGNDWTDGLNKIMHQARETMLGGMMPNSSAFNGLFGMPMDTMQRVMASSSGFPGDVFKSFGSMKPQGASVFDPTMRASMEQFLSTPAIGYTRESQEQHQQMVVRVMEYQESIQEYMALVSKALTESLDLFHKKILERGAADKPIHSLRELYNLLVECGEEVFGEVAATPNYGRVNARMINAMMSVKSSSRLLIEKSMAAMNMPNRTELDTAHRNVLELKRRVRAMEDEIRSLRKRDMEPAVAAIREDMDQLPIKEFRSELEKLKKQMQGSLFAQEKNEGEGEGEQEDAGEGDDKPDAANRTAPRRPRVTRAKPQSEGA